MKFDILSLVKRCLEKEREMLLRAIESARRARDSAPSAMESHHDTERNQNERLVVALEEKLLELDNLIRDIPKKFTDNDNTQGIWSYHEITKNGNELKIIIVPEGYGGGEIEGIKLVSVNTPIAKSIHTSSDADLS